MEKTLNINRFKWFPVAIVLIYVPFHLSEEALGNFPLWMFEHYGMPEPLSYPHWLLNNGIFLTVLLTGLILFLKSPEKRIIFGTGILLWGIMNSFEHIIFTIADQKISPGFITSFLFLLIGISGLVYLSRRKAAGVKLLLKSFGIALAYWGTAFLFIILIGLYLMR
jgi:glycosyltransferase involved in cell wall biosynthesis